MRLLLALPLVLCAAACGDDGGGSAGEGDLPDRAVVLTGDHAQTDAHGEQVTWTPQTDDVLAAEDALARYIEDHPDLGLDPLEGYARQYLGIGPDDGELVSVNAFCTTEDPLDDWREELEVVQDGGACFWQARFDPALDRMLDLTVNGEA